MRNCIRQEERCKNEKYLVGFLARSNCSLGQLKNDLVLMADFSQGHFEQNFTFVLLYCKACGQIIAWPQAWTSLLGLILHIHTQVELPTSTF